MSVQIFSIGYCKQIKKVRNIGDNKHEKKNLGYESLGAEKVFRQGGEFNVENVWYSFFVGALRHTLYIWYL